MIVRYSIKCSTCDAIHTLRIGVGHSNYQKHNIKCCKCDEDIVVGLSLDQANTKISGLVCIDNCEPSDDEGTIVNIHPDFVFPEEHINTDLYFGAVEQLHYMRTKQADPSDNKQAAGFVDEWAILRMAWSFNIKGKTDLLNAKLEARFKDRQMDIHDYLFQFLTYFVAEEGKCKFESIMSTIGTIRRMYPAELTRFLEYYYTNLKKEHALVNYELFDDFFKDFTEYNQLYLYYTNGLAIPDGFKATSSNYRATKMFYGNCYEVFTSHIIILAALNNIANGRKYDEFEKMNLAKYKSIDKSGRCNPFKDNEAFYAICEELDSSLRNASHHVATKLNTKTGIITYRSGGTGSIKTMSYAQYLSKCIGIMMSSCILYMIELTFIYNEPTESKPT